MENLLLGCLKTILAYLFYELVTENSLELPLTYSPYASFRDELSYYHSSSSDRNIWRKYDPS
jgi:hypothetical protein